MSKDRTASAIPQHLFNYSDQATRAAQEVETWLRTVFVPAAHAYLQGAAPKAGYAAVDVGAVKQLADSLVADLHQNITAVYNTDREVRVTGRAFLEAGGQGPLSRIGLVNPDQVIRTTDSRVEDAPRQAGAAVAAALRTSPASAFAALRANLDDPTFCATFLRVLTPEQRTFFLTLAFRGQAPDGTGLDGVRRQLSAPDADGPEMVPYHQLALDVVAAGMPELSPTEVKQWMGQVAPYVKQLTPGGLRAVLPDLTQFLMAGVTHSAGPIGGQNPELWAKGFGAEVATEVNPYLAILKAADIRIDDHNALVKSIVQGAVINTLTAPLAFVPLPGATVPAKLGAAAAFNFVVGALESYAAGKDPTNAFGISSLMKEHDGNADVITLNAAVNVQAGWSATIASLIAGGKVIDSSGRALAFKGGDEDAALIAKVIRDSGRYYFKGGTTGTAGLSMAFLLDAFNTGATNIPPDSGLAHILRSH